MFLIIFLFSSEVQKDSGKTRDYFKERYECMRIASIISSIYSSGEGTSVKTKTNYTIEIRNQSIRIGNATCNFFADTMEKNITGNLTIKNRDKKIMIDNY
jgi:hypothetical protein